MPYALTIFLRWCKEVGNGDWWTFQRQPAEIIDQFQMMWIEQANAATEPPDVKPPWLVPYVRPSKEDEE